MMTAGAEFDQPLHDCVAKVENFERMLKTELEKKEEIQKYMQCEQIEELIKEVYNNINKDIKVYIQTEERVIYEELVALKHKQLKLFDKLNNRRNGIISELNEFNTLLSKMGYEKYKASYAFNHDNPNFKNRAFEDLEAVTFNCTSIKSARYQEDMSRRSNC